MYCTKISCKLKNNSACIRKCDFKILQYIFYKIMHFLIDLLVYVVPLLTLILVLSIIYQFTFWKKRGIVHIDVLPLLGHFAPLYFRSNSIVELSKKLYFHHRAAKYYGSFDLNTPSLVLKDPDLIREVCVKNFDFFPDHSSFVTEEQDPVIGSNVFSLTGAKWREVRSALSPSFTSWKMKFMLKLVDDCTRQFVDNFVKNKKLAREFESKDVFSRYTNDVIASVAFGVVVDSIKNPENEFYVCGQDAVNFGGFLRILKLLTLRMFPNIMRKVGFTFLSRKSDQFFKKLIHDTVKTRREKGIVRPDMLQLLMESKFNNNEIVGQAFIFFFGGFETSSSLMCLACHELAANPEIQEKLRKEIDENFQDYNSKITYESLSKLKYLEMVLNETLRFYPPLSLTNRICKKHFLFPPARPGDRDLIIEPGMIVNIPIIGLHHDSRYFENPEIFDPERFNDENKSQIDPYVFIPFGVGARKCIGDRFALMETKILIVRILQKFVIKFTDKSRHPITFSKKKFQLVSDNGFWLNFQERKKMT